MSTNGMRHVMLVGAIGAGKRTLVQALSGGTYIPRRAMALEYCGRYINTPGEFLENPRFYHALITSAATCDTLLFLQSAISPCSLYPPGFSTLFNRRVLGLITCVDAESAKPIRAVEFLQLAGVREVLEISVHTGQGMVELTTLLAPSAVSGKQAS